MASIVQVPQCIVRRGWYTLAAVRGEEYNGAKQRIGIGTVEELVDTLGSGPRSHCYLMIVLGRGQVVEARYVGGHEGCSGIFTLIRRELGDV